MRLKINIEVITDDNGNCCYIIIHEHGCCNPKSLAVNAPASLYPSSTIRGAFILKYSGGRYTIPSLECLQINCVPATLQDVNDLICCLNAGTAPVAGEPVEEIPTIIPDPVPIDIGCLSCTASVSGTTAQVFADDGQKYNQLCINSQYNIKNSQIASPCYYLRVCYTLNTDVGSSQCVEVLAPTNAFDTGDLGCPVICDVRVDAIAPDAYITALEGGGKPDWKSLPAAEVAGAEVFNISLTRPAKLADLITNGTIAGTPVPVEELCVTTSCRVVGYEQLTLESTGFVVEPPTDPECTPDLAGLVISSGDVEFIQGGAGQYGYTATLNSDNSLDITFNELHDCLVRISYDIKKEVCATPGTGSTITTSSDKPTVIESMSGGTTIALPAVGEGEAINTDGLLVNTADVIYQKDIDFTCTVNSDGNVLLTFVEPVGEVGDPCIVHVNYECKLEQPV